MRLKESSVDLHPSVQQIKNYRHMLSSKEKPEAYSVECLGELRAFIDDPLTDVKILTDYVVLSEDRVLSPFCVDSDEMDQLWVQASLHAGLMDLTFKKKKEGLLLGCCGPAGFHILPGKPPSMRVMPPVLLAVVFGRRPSAAVVTKPFCCSQPRAGWRWRWTRGANLAPTEMTSH